MTIICLSHLKLKLLSYLDQCPKPQQVLCKAVLLCLALRRAAFWNRALEYLTL